jgi:uncharacterized UPF0160 family protein
VIDSNIVKKSFGTHDGTFHADEVSACALLLIFDLIDRDFIIRTRQENELSQCEYVCDVGGTYDPALKRFDHHQVQYNGEKSSAGLVLQYLKDTSLITKQEWVFINESVIMGVDAHDNGRYNPEKGICTFSHIVSNFVPIEYETSPEELKSRFLEAVDFAYCHLKRLIERFRYNLSCRDQINQKMAHSQEVLVFDEPLPWLDNFFAIDGLHHPARFVIMPAGHYWKLRSIPPSLSERMKVRQPMPLSWAGLMDDDLAKISGLEGSVFCHKGRFISVWKTKEDAIEACRKILSGEAV